MATAKNPRFEGKIQSWGNSMGLRITRPVGDLANLSLGSIVEIEVTDQGLIIKPKVKKTKKLLLPFTESQLIKGLTPDKAHADELPTLINSEIGD